MDMIGPWIKRCKLGYGGNGEVWNCKHNVDRTIAAVKFLRKNKIGSASYNRFCSEITLLRNLGETKGILPLLQSNLPPDGNNPAGVPWLSMPVAQSLENGFPDETPLETIVAGLSNAANTLSALAKEGIHHRDIKPSNLFIYNNEVVVGDFGLATYPTKIALTVEGKKLGPLFFIAPEMLEYSKETDESLADVYSLAKTLWVLLTGQKYPPPGEQRAIELSTNISNYVNHAKIYLLDRLIDLATRHKPSDRIRLSDFADELNAWNKEDSSNSVEFGNDITELNHRLQTALTPSLSKEAKEGVYKELFEKCKKALLPSLQELMARIPPLENITIELAENMALRGTLGNPANIEFPLEGPLVALTGPGKVGRPLMFCTLGFCDRKQEKTSLMAHHVVQMEGGKPKIVWSDSRDVVLGGSTMELAIAQLVAGLKENFIIAFRKYVELVESHRANYNGM